MDAPSVSLLLPHAMNDPAWPPLPTIEVAGAKPFDYVHLRDYKPRPDG